MTRRERVLKALRFEEPDLTPYEIGLTHPLKVEAEKYFGTADVSEAFGNHLHVLGTSPSTLWKEFRPGFWRDEFGVVWDRTIDEDIGTTTTDYLIPEPDFSRYAWPDPLDQLRFAELDGYSEARPERFIVADFGFTLFERAWTLRGMENVLMDMVTNEEFADSFFDAICDWNLAVVRKILSYPVDAVLFGDDWGSQRGLIMGPKLWRRFLKPRLARMYKPVVDAGKTVMIHSCGDVDELFDDLVEIGVKVFNPFQPEVMDTFALADACKGRLAFYGGISTQKLLPYGTPDEVRAGVHEIVRRIGRSGDISRRPPTLRPRTRRSRTSSRCGRCCAAGLSSTPSGSTHVTRRERVIKALRFEEPDAVPYQIGMTAPVRAMLAEHFGDEDVSPVLGNHLMSVSARRAAVWKEERAGLWRDEFGVLWDRTIDTDTGNPVEYVLPEPTLSGYTWPDPRAPYRFVSSAKAFEKPDDRFSIASIGHALFERAWIMRGMENILFDMAANPAFLHELLDAICDWSIEVMDGMLDYPFDAVWIGDDWGAQTGLIMGPKYWREFIRPRMERMYARARDKGRHVFIHCCGDVDEIFDDLIDIGVGVFNPFQPEVMDTFNLAKRYKGRLAFWGGISTQELLPRATPGEVARETRRIVRDIGAGGGYIAAPAHDIQRDVPLENILAMWEVLRGGGQ